MRKGLVDRTLRKFFKLDEPTTGIKQDDCEDFAIKGAHFRTESVINAFRVVEMLLGEGIFAGQGAEAQGSNQSSGFGLREEAAEVSEARTCQPGERAVSARSWPAKVESEASNSKLRASISVRASGPRAVSRCIGLEYNAIVSLTVWLIGK